MSEEINLIWKKIRSEVKILSDNEPILSQFYYSMILRHQSFIPSLSFILSNILGNKMITNSFLQDTFEKLYFSDISLIKSVVKDMYAVYNQDPVINHYSSILLYLKGFHALQIYRMSHQLWKMGRKSLALFLQNTVSVLLSVDIHPAADIGYGIMFDHATGIVIGETALVENNVSILQSVTLGSTGKTIGKRHPTIREGVVIGAGAKILGNIEIGLNSKIGAGAVVLSSVPSYSTAAGVPARIISKSIEINS
ncbi:serine O-acetyltransferase [Buchnera aphidicola]|uniref:serine O-acetyltransferase n=1 Tax=Buchnera aphidicola TaxID=9 RepID=UPI003463F9F9